MKNKKCKHKYMEAYGFEYKNGKGYPVFICADCKKKVKA